MEEVYTIDAVTNKKIPISASRICLVDYIRNHFVFGYTQEEITSISIFKGDVWVNVCVPVGFFKDDLIYHCGLGQYVLNRNISPYEKIRIMYQKSTGYPYTFSKKYEAVENFNIFKNKQEVLTNINFPISKYFKYTFGLEYETSTGIVPEDICFRDGLIPLRDGSISGNEYSTVVLSGNEGFNLMYQQIKTLRKYTRFDKECSLHIHMGGFPLIPEKILSLYNLCYNLQSELKSALPAYTFYTAKYKNSGKDYCKLLPQGYKTFNEYYQTFAKTKFFGDLTQAHPNDVERARKWQIHERYYWANLLNLICYKVNKTMEFRMLRPTYNLEKILTWMYIFNAIMQYAENFTVSNTCKITVEQILHEIYPKELSEKITFNFYKCVICSDDQRNNGDFIGARTDIEDEYFERDMIF